MCATLVAHDVYMNRITLFIGYITQRLRRRCLELPQPIASAMMAMFLAVLLIAKTQHFQHVAITVSLLQRLAGCWLHLSVICNQHQRISVLS